VCGIAGIINNNRNDFDYSTFCALGIGNDRRGGDSTGIFIDGEAEYGIGTKAHFEDFFWDSKLLNNTQNCKIALLHDRKASKGGVSLEKAHPIIIKEPVKVAEGEAPREEIKFVLVHNGTIHNDTELAKKYIPHINVTGYSDSQILALLLYYTGFDFLAEYSGGAAFVAVDYRKSEPQVFLWRGESKRTYSSDKPEEERPLFINYSDDRLVFSSIASYLTVLTGDAYYLAPNKVVSYKNGIPYVVKEIDRSKMTQTSYGAVSSYNNTYGYNRNDRTVNNHSNEKWPRDYYDGYNDEWDTLENDQYSTPKWLMQEEFTNRYTIDGKFVHGKLYITQWGRVCSSKNQPGWDSYEVWFFNGVALSDGRKAYKFLEKAQKMSKLDIASFFVMQQNLIRYLTIDQVYNIGAKWYEAHEPFERRLYNGEFQMLGKSTKYTIKNGERDMTKIEHCDAEIPFAQIIVTQRIDYKTLWKRFIQSIV